MILIFWGSAWWSVVDSGTDCPPEACWRSSAFGETLRLSWQPKVHYPVLSQINPHDILIPSIFVIPNFRYECKVAFRVMLPDGRRILRYCLRREPASPRPIPKLEVRPLSAVHYCIFSIFAAALHIWRSLLLPQPEEEPCRGDGDPLITQIFIFVTEMNRIRLTLAWPKSLPMLIFLCILLTFVGMVA